jgi:hypothetical protein
MATKASNIAQAARTVDASGNVDGDTLDSLDSSQFLRSDTSDTMNGNLFVTGGNYFTVDTSGYFFSGNGNYDAGIFATGTTLTTIRTQSNLGFDVNSSRRMTINSTGDVGIGTTSPQGRLDVRGDGDLDLANISIGSGTYGTVSIISDNVANNGADATPMLMFKAPFASSTDRIGYGAIQGGKEGSIQGYRYGYLKFLTHDHATGLVEAMRIDSSGKIGIGTDAPLEKLHIVENNGGGDVAIRVNNYSALENTTSSIRFTNTDGNDTYDHGAVVAGRTPAPYLSLQAGNGVEGIRINNTGRIGIATGGGDVLDIPGTAHDTVVIGDGSATHRGAIIHTTANGSFGFYDGGSTPAARLMWNGSNHTLNLYTRNEANTAEAPRIVIDTNGVVSFEGDALNLPVASSDPTAGIRAGTIYYNSSDLSIKLYDGNSWQSISTQFVATGGTITEVSSGGSTYKVHTFTSSGTFEITAGVNTIEYLVIAGGGGISAIGNDSGGGGAGGYRSSVPGESSGGGASSEPTLLLGVGSYNVVVGAGGGLNSNGSNSSFHTITSIGGGVGGSGTAPFTVQPGNGGSGGGVGNSDSRAGGSGTSGQGYKGGNCYSDIDAAGGGGAGGAGGNAPAGIGGVGVTSSITGTPVGRAGGGGGGGEQSHTNQASDGGGVGTNTGNGTNGTPNTGGGSGGAGGEATASSGSGGSGIVIVRYKI